MGFYYVLLEPAAHHWTSQTVRTELVSCRSLCGPNDITVKLQNGGHRQQSWKRFPCILQSHIDKTWQNQYKRKHKFHWFLCQKLFNPWNILESLPIRSLLCTNHFVTASVVLGHAMELQKCKTPTSTWPSKVSQDWDSHCFLSEPSCERSGKTTKDYKKQESMLTFSFTRLHQCTKSTKICINLLHCFSRSRKADRYKTPTTKLSEQVIQPHWEQGHFRERLKHGWIQACSWVASLWIRFWCWSPRGQSERPSKWQPTNWTPRPVI